MPVDLKSIGSKLRTYREQLQESLQDVSSETGIPTDRLAAIEQGSTRPTGDEILILADHWTCDFQLFVSDTVKSPLKDTDILYRRHGDAFSKQDRRAVREFLYLCETEQFLMEEVGHVVRRFSFEPRGRFYKAHATEAALALRRFFDYEMPGRPAVPRNVYADFRDIGVHVFRRKLSNSNISGLFIDHPGAGRCLLVNYNEDVYRQRFTASHEMAHAIFDADREVVVSFVRPDQRDRLVEVRANRFASCFLLPPSMLERLPDPAGWVEADVLKWAHEFRVSCDALGIALKEAGRANDATSKRIRGFRLPFDTKLDPELSGNLSAVMRNKKKELLQRGLSDLYVRLCFDAHDRGLISTGRLAEAMLTDSSDLIQIAGLYGRALRYAD